jgi:hypothetical protein
VGRVPLANGLEAKDTPLLIPYYPDGKINSRIKEREGRRKEIG